MRDGVLLCNRAQPGEVRHGSARKHCWMCGEPVWVYWINLMYDASIVCGECAAGLYLGRVIAKAEEDQEVA